MAEAEREVWTVAQAAAVTGAKEATIRAAVRRGAIEPVGLGGVGGYGNRRWLLDPEDVIAWHRRSGLPGPAADPVR